LGSAIGDSVAAVVLCEVAVALYLSLPRHGDIWWMDASRHALNGALVLDFLRAMPLRDPMEFAIDYYRQWPALTIGFYPPLFSMALAASYAIFGVSEAAALLPELAFLALLAWGAYRLSQHWLDAAPALAVALLIMGSPEISYWGRQVMLDVPSYAFLIWAVEFQMRYIKGESPRALNAAAVFAVLAISTKYNAAFIVGPMVVALLHARGWRFAFDPAALRAAALGTVLMLPPLTIFSPFPPTTSTKLPRFTARHPAGASRP
jgi:4-amino-4-deoxy-L-arabinose transferase-like glycosyltransferase